MSVEGVLNFRDLHIWTLSSDSLMGSLYVLVHPQADVFRSINQVRCSWHIVNRGCRAMWFSLEGHLDTGIVSRVLSHMEITSAYKK